jgi:hypothetical protein
MNVLKRQIGTTSALHPAEASAGAGAAGAGSSPAVVRNPRTASLGKLLGSHVLRDGEMVLMILKPSVWFIVFESIAFAVIVVLAAALLAVIEHHKNDYVNLQLASFFVAGRLMWAALQWMGRLYILTDLRVLRITGVFGVEIFDCPLRKVLRTRMVSPTREKLVGVGSIEIIPSDETEPTAVWQTIAKPREIQQRLQAAIARAKQSGMGSE